MIFIITAFLFLLTGCESNSESGKPTLPGADEIYPTVMVNGELYEWRLGRAIQDKLPDTSNYEASIEHSNEKTPTENYEFVSTFDVTGEIYTIPDDNSCVYLLISTDWMQEKMVAFDRVSKIEQPKLVWQAGEVTPRDDVLMELSDKDGKPYITITNQGQETLGHGNAGSSSLQANVDGVWYHVPMLPNWVTSLEGYILEPGQTYSGTFTWDAYGKLADGDYRIVFCFTQDDSEKTYAVTEFSIINGDIVF